MPAFSFFRTVVLALLVAISSLVYAPEHHSAMGQDAVAAGAEGLCRATGIHHSTVQLANPATAEDAAQQCASLEEEIVMTAFDTQGEHAGRAIEMLKDDQMISFAFTTATATPQHAFSDNGGNPGNRGAQGEANMQALGGGNAGPMASSISASASSTGNPRQRAPFHDSGTIAQQEEHFNPPTDNTETGRLAPIASGGVERGGLDPLMDSGGGKVYPDNQGSTFIPVADFLDATAVVALAKNSGKAYPDNQNSAFIPVADLLDATAVVALAKNGEEDRPNPAINASSEPDVIGLIDPPDWGIEPTTGGNDSGNIPAAKCDSNGTCDALPPTASNAVPEPGSLALLGLGTIGLVLSRRRKAAFARQ